jgi:hypothetical protein
MTTQEVIDSMTEEQRTVMNYMISVAFDKGKQGSSAEHSATGTDDNDNNGTGGEGAVEHQEGSADVTATRNIFESQNAATVEAQKNLSLAHDAMRDALKEVFKENGMTFKQAVAAAHEKVLAHGITNVEMLFPEARTVGGAQPQWISRRMEWVAPVINGTSKTPFSRVKTVWSDITADEARARGYVKGTYKKEEWFGVQKRTTTPTTIYKKQRLDRDDVIDVEEFDLVAWMRGEMRVMIEEEIARAILLGDGRAVDDPDKIKDPMAATDGAGIRSILNEHEYFAVRVNVNVADANSSYLEPIEEIIKARRFYKGSGNPTLFTTEEQLVNMLLLKDEANSNRRLFNTEAELAAYLRVKEIVAVEVMENAAYSDVFGIIVNLKDYNIGSSRGGELTNFDDFDINYNQYLYLIETRLSGALIVPFSALVIRKTTVANVIDVVSQPTFNTTTGVVTIPTQTGVVYKNADTDATLTAGAQSALAAGATLNVKAVPASGSYIFRNSVQDGPWPYKRPAA